MARKAERPKIAQPAPCLLCGAVHASIVIGPPMTRNPYRLCYTCWIQTPCGQQQALLHTHELNDNGPDIPTE